MKHKLFALSFLMAAFYSAKPQMPQTPIKLAKTITYVTQLKNGETWNYGFLSVIDDSSVQLSTKRVAFSNLSLGNPYFKKYNYADIDKMKIRKHGSIGRGIVFGALIGVGVGAIVGLATYKKPAPSNGWFTSIDFGPGVSALGGAIFGILPGTIIGGIIGSKKRKFIVNRNRGKFMDMKSVILEMAITGKNRK
jgi:hypothetical protein